MPVPLPDLQALDVIRLLEELGADVVNHDPYVRTFEEDGIQHDSVALTDKELERSDAVVIVTDHASVDYRAWRTRRA